MPPDQQPAPCSEPTPADLADALLMATRGLVAMAVRTLAEGRVPVTLGQHRVLLFLEEGGPLAVNDVADRLGVDQSNASRHCSRLAALGLVRRTQAAQDRRSVVVALTAAGRRQVHAVRSARRDWAEQVLSLMPDHEARVAVRALQLFSEASASV